MHSNKVMGDQEVNAAAQQLSHALAVMHQPGAVAEDRAAASSWLEKFQQTALAWKVPQTKPALLPCPKYAVHAVGHNAASTS